LYKEQITHRNQAIREINKVETLNEYIESEGWVLKRNKLPGTMLSVAADRHIVREDYLDYVGQQMDYKHSIVIVLNDTVTAAIRGATQKMKLSLASRLYNVDHKSLVFKPVIALPALSACGDCQNPGVASWH
jgi:hypothetical protein